MLKKNVLIIILFTLILFLVSCDSNNDYDPDEITEISLKVDRLEIVAGERVTIEITTDSYFQNTNEYIEIVVSEKNIIYLSGIRNDKITLEGVSMGEVEIYAMSKANNTIKSNTLKFHIKPPYDLYLDISTMNLKDGINQEQKFKYTNNLEDKYIYDVTLLGINKLGNSFNFTSSEIIESFILIDNIGHGADVWSNNSFIKEIIINLKEPVSEKGDYFSVLVIALPPGGKDEYYSFSFEANSKKGVVTYPIVGSAIFIYALDGSTNLDIESITIKLGFYDKY